MPRSHPAQTVDLPAGAVAKETTYEAALAELEQIVQRMEGGQLPLEESIAAYRRGSELLKHCQQQLADAERKIEVLEGGALRDFDAASGAAQ
ncbi:MAG: exodeoxyribonuclease small subunit [Proteobacteria bacterium]|nr:exodeoxyribonuclease small subunit [Pseudomonadota bacterium]